MNIEILNDSQLAQLDQLIASADTILITCHKSPDGDAIGSCLGWAEYLRSREKEAIVIVPDQYPDFLQWMPNTEKIIRYDKHTEKCDMLFKIADLVFCLDFNTPSRVNEMEAALVSSPAPKVLIDHHLDPEDAFDLSISFPEASSTCELVFRVIMQMGLLRLMDRYAASCLYVGLLTDTGGFAYSCDNPEFYEILASITRRHIDRINLYNKAMNTFSADSLRLQGFAISEKMQLFPDQGASLITLDKDELERFNYNRGDTETLVNKPLAIPGIYWSVFLREDADRIKVSCRSQGSFSVSDICARYFNGGGHENAAGGEFFGTIDETVQVFHQVLADLFPNQHQE